MFRTVIKRYLTHTNLKVLRAKLPPQIRTLRTTTRKIFQFTYSFSKLFGFCNKSHTFDSSKAWGI